MAWTPGGTAPERSHWILSSAEPHGAVTVGGVKCRKSSLTDRLGTSTSCSPTRQHSVTSSLLYPSNAGGDSGWNLLCGNPSPKRQRGGQTSRSLAPTLALGARIATEQLE